MIRRALTFAFSLALLVGVSKPGFSQTGPISSGGGGGGAISSNACATADAILKQTSTAGTALDCSSWTDASGLLTSTTATGLGLTTATPKTIGSETATGSVLHVTSATDARVVASGTTARFELYDTDAAGNPRASWEITGGRASFNILNAAGATQATVFALNMASTLAEVGSASVAGISYISGTGNHVFSDGVISTALGIGVSETAYGAAPIGTVGSGTGVTVNVTGDYRRVINKVTLTYAAWAAAATTADKTIYTLAAKQRLVGIIADVTATFTGGAVSDADMTCGKTAGGNEYLVSFDVDTATGTYGDADAELGTSINRANAIQGGDLPSWSATTALTCRLTTVGANTDALTAGSITFYIITEMM